MITKWDEYQELGKDFQAELLETKGKVFKNHKSLKVCVNLDKENKIYTDQNYGITFKDNGDHYKTYFGQGPGFPRHKVGLAWISDKHTTFFFERPFQNTVVKTLKKLLPDKSIKYDGNDIYIDGAKLSPSLRTGWGRIKGENPESPVTDADTGRIYVIRWDNLDGLMKAFEGNKHHEDRIAQSKLTTLSEHLTGITKEQFEYLLENEKIN